MARHHNGNGNVPVKDKNGAIRYTNVTVHCAPIDLLRYSADYWSKLRRELEEQQAREEDQVAAASEE